MALTVCPRCHRPAELVDSGAIGQVETREAGVRDVTERRLACACVPIGEVLVVWRIDLVQGTDTKRTVPH